MTIMRYKSLLQIANILAVLLTIIINALANILPLNGKYTGELSDAIPNLFVPSGLTFSIWGVIYILLVAFAVYQAWDLFKKEKVDMPFLFHISFLLILASVANIVWIFLWHYEQIGYSLLAMLILFFSLLAIYVRLDIGRGTVPWKEKVFVHVPFSVYIGWITVATVANITAVLVTVGWDGFGISEMMWTILVLVVVTLVALLMLVTRKDIAYCLVIIWALVGIIIKRLQTDPVYGVQTEIATTAAIAAIIIGLGIIAITALFYRHPHPKKA